MLVSRNEVEEYKYTVASMANENKTNYIVSIGVTMEYDKVTFLTNMVNKNKQSTLQHST